MPDGSSIDTENVTKVIAAPFSITVGIADNRQITFQSGFEGDEPDAAVNARIDRIMRFADRQEARYQVPALEEELFKHRDTLANFIEDYDRLALNHPKAQADRQVQIDELERLRPEERSRVEAQVDTEILKVQELKAEEIRLGSEEYRSGGRMGSYVPRGARKVNIARCDESLAKLDRLKTAQLEQFDLAYDARIESVRAEIVKADNEYEQARSNQEITINRYKEAIAEREAKLVRAQALVEG